MMLRHCAAFGLAIALAQPVAAFERMLISDCTGALDRIGDMFIAAGAHEDKAALNVVADAFRVTPDGWCELRAEDLDDLDADFETLAWRAEEVSRWTRDSVPPLALEFLVTGLNPDFIEDPDFTGNVPTTDRPDFEFSIVLRQIPDAGQVIIEQAVFQNDAGDVLSFSGVLERVFLSSTSMMQVSIGSAVFKAGLASMTREGTYQNPFGFWASVEVNGTSQSKRDAAFETISNLPDGFIDDASRAELMAYAGDLPRPVGTIEFSLASERGFGLMQLGGALTRSVTRSFELEGASDFDFDVLLSGMTLRADWSPAAQVAD